jgi:hypothetical protein
MLTCNLQLEQMEGAVVLKAHSKSLSTHPSDNAPA